VHDRTSRCSRCDGAEEPRHPLRPVPWHLLPLRERRRWRLDRESGAAFRVCSECYGEMAGGQAVAP
jgi:hypothetical protein